MLIGVPAETMPGETRVAVTPETAKKLKAQGHTVRVQSGAGVAASVPDAAFEAVGAEITDAAGAYAADIVLKVRCPQDSEMSLARSGGVLMGMERRAAADVVRGGAVSEGCDRHRDQRRAECQSRQRVGHAEGLLRHRHCRQVEVDRHRAGQGDDRERCREGRE